MEIKQILTTIVLVAIILVIYYASYFPKIKEQKEAKKMQENLKKGDKIVTFSGLSGTIEEIEKDRIILKTRPNNTLLSIEKWAVAGIDDREI